MEQLARTPKQIGAALQRRRKALGLSQEELGDKVQLRQSTISTLESGDPGTKLNTLLDVIAGLDLEVVLRERTRSGPGIEDLF